jgi:hypothetical protein
MSQFMKMFRSIMSAGMLTAAMLSVLSARHRLRV